LDAEIKKCRKAIETQAKNDPNDAIYQTLPGVGKLSARVLSNELGDLQQFNNERKAYSFCGLTPSEYSSGESVRRGHITRQGSGRLRRVLTQCAWAAIRKDAGLRSVYDRIAARAGGKKAIIAVAKKLIGRARAIFKTGEVYDIETSIKAAA
jgi:transposase